MPLPWTAALLPEAPLLALVAGLAGAIAGALLALSLKQALPGRALSRVLAVASLALVMAVVADGLVTTAPQGLRATVRLTNLSGGPGREVAATARIRPASAAADARWLTITSWQGGGLVVDRLRSLGGGVYRSTEPIPVSGEWKTTLRLQTGRTIAGLPIYLPADRAIPAAAVPAPSRFQRAFVSDKRILQRETKQRGPGLAHHRRAVARPGHCPLPAGRPRPRPGTAGARAAGRIEPPPVGDWRDAQIPATAGAGLSEHRRVVVIGAGFSGIGLGIRMLREGIDDFVVLEKADGPRRHLGGEHLPGNPVRHPFAPLLVLLHAEPGLDPHLLGGGGDLGLPAALRPGGRRHPAPAARLRAARRRVGRRGEALASGDLGRADQRLGADRRDRGPLGALDPRDTRPRLLRRSSLPLGTVGPRVRPPRQAGRGGRDRRLGDPDRPADPARGGEAPRLPAHRRPG